MSRESPLIVAETRANIAYVLAAVMRYLGVLSLGVTLGILFSGDIAYQACTSVPLATSACKTGMSTLHNLETTGAVAAVILFLGGAILDSQTTITRVDES